MLVCCSDFSQEITSTTSLREHNQYLVHWIFRDEKMSADLKRGNETRRHLDGESLD